MPWVCHMSWACLGVSLAILVFIRLSRVCLGCRGVLVLHWSRLSFALACIYLKPVNNYPAVLAFVKCTLGFGLSVLALCWACRRFFGDLGTIWCLLLSCGVILWGCPRAAWATLEQLGTILGSSSDHPGSIEVNFWPSWNHLGPSWGILKPSWAYWNHLGTSLEVCF